jgi:exodeoxyribonuclease VII large subunit
MVEQANSSIFSIQEINARVRAIVERETIGKPFWMEGSVRKHYVSDLNHQYFELYDSDNFSIRCMVRDTVTAHLPFSIANGVDLEVFGTIRVFEKRASLEFEVAEVKLRGRVLPPLPQDIEKRLEREGLWPRTPRLLPETIKRIGLITSQHSEAKDDFEKNYKEYGGTAKIISKHVRLQGESAPREIADAIRMFSSRQIDPVDVIVLTRGGGRNVDLNVFSDYHIVKEICLSHVPIATGIGHESDQTVADRVSDVPKGTPTAIAVFLAQWGREQEPDQTRAPSAQTKLEMPPDPEDSRFVKLGRGLLWVLIALALVVAIILTILSFL